MKAIYKIINNLNGKIYIGQSNNPNKRFLDHCYKKEKYESLISKAINKYGKENFTLEILGWFENFNEKEKYYIIYYGSRVPNGYNIAPGGENPPIGSHRTINQELASKIQQELLNWDIQRAQIIKSNKITSDIFRHLNEGSSWKNSELSYPLRPGELELNNARALKVINLLQTTKLTQIEIGKQVGWNRSAVTMINIGQNHFQENLQYPIRK